MKFIFKPLAITITIAAAGALLAVSKPVTPLPAAPPKIQAAILLDVSNSMDGLIEQAKAQLWNMVNTMGKAKCSGDVAPQIEIALYEYGRTSNSVKEGYVKQINSFITNLDSLSENLFNLTTNGGDEYCGHVIYNSINELKWDAVPGNYKVIFIAGNEDFLQGDIDYIKACNAAKQKGVIVNTIYCGEKMQGIKEHWNLNAECGNGSYTNINQNATIEEIPTPYDSMIYVMNDHLNSTYLAYGYSGASYAAKQSKMDGLNSTMSTSAGIKRVTAKSNSAAYKNTEWDLVDKYKSDSISFNFITKAELPDSLKNKSKDELKIIVQEKSKQRTATQQQIIELNKQRDVYIAKEKVKRANSNYEPTLETAVEKIIKEQAKRYNMKIE